MRRGTMRSRHLRQQLDDRGDKAAFNDGGDRNLYVNSVNYDAAAVSSTVTGIYQSPFFPPLATKASCPATQFTR